MPDSKQRIEEMYLSVAKDMEVRGRYEDAGFKYHEVPGFEEKAKEMYLKTAIEYEEDEEWHQAALFINSRSAETTPRQKR